MANVEKEALWLTLLKHSRYVFSFFIIGFSGFIIVYGILANESGFHRTFPSAHPALQLVIFFALIAFFGLLEGGHVCVVDLSKHSTETFKETYKSAASTHKWVSGPNIFNLSKYLMGRQVLVIFNQFFLGSLASFPDMVNFPFTDVPFPTLFKKIMVDTGLLNVVFVTTFGSLVPQLIATRYPVQFMNLLGIKIIVLAGLIIEASGVAHFSWVLHDIVAKWILRLDYNVTKQVMASDEPEEEKDALSVEVSKELTEDFWTVPLPTVVEANGEYKTAVEVATEWEARGCKLPNAFSAINHVSQMETIRKLMQLADADSELRQRVKDIVFVQ